MEMSQPFFSQGNFEVILFSRKISVKLPKPYFEDKVFRMMFIRKCNDIMKPRYIDTTLMYLALLTEVLLPYLPIYPMTFKSKRLQYFASVT